MSHGRAATHVTSLSSMRATFCWLLSFAGLVRADPLPRSEADNANLESVRVEPENSDPEATTDPLVLGLQWSWVAHQIVTGPALALGLGRVWFDGEAPFLFTTRSAPELRGNYLGNRLGGGMSVALLDSKRWRGRLGAGADRYALWGIHSKASRLVFALRG